MKHTTWIRIASILQFITALTHSMSFFVKPVAANETEQQLIDLMSGYSMDMGGEIHRTMEDLLNALSACLPLLFVMGGLINWYLVSKHAGNRILKGVITINVIIFGIALVVFILFAFWPPIILTGLVFITLVISFIMIPKEDVPQLT